MSNIINLEDNFKDVLMEIFNQNLPFKEITLNKEISLKKDTNYKIGFGSYDLFSNVSIDINTNNIDENFKLNAYLGKNTQDGILQQFEKETIDNTLKYKLQFKMTQLCYDNFVENENYQKYKDIYKKYLSNGYPLLNSWREDVHLNILANEDIDIKLNITLIAFRADLRQKIGTIPMIEYHTNLEKFNTFLLHSNFAFVKNVEL